VCALGAAGALALLVGVAAGCQQSPDARPAPPVVTRDVTLAPIQQRALPIVYPVPGVVVPTERLQVASRVSGFIEKVHVDEGDRVEAGAPLVDIDEAQVQAMIRAAEAALASSRAERADAADDVERYQRLARGQVLAEDQLRKARVRLAQAQAQVEQARAELDARRQEQRYTRIKSPVHGLVRERLRDPGDLVTAGEPILRLDVLGAMELEVFVPATRVDAIAEGQSVAVELDAAASPLTGRVLRVIRSADPVTRRCKLRIALPGGRQPTPGQFGQANLVIGQETVATVPQAAVVTRAGIEGVFVADADGNARFRSVRLGRRWAAERELVAGVEVGRVIVVRPPPTLRDGDRVRQRVGDVP
jgi:RND family efflux transporter MFP subunit